MSIAVKTENYGKGNLYLKEMKEWNIVLFSRDC